MANRDDKSSGSHRMESQSTKNRPKAGDGTLLEERDSVQANWHGSSQRPQEEFISDHSEDSKGRRETPQPQNHDVFPSGGPEAQSDG